jgi:hypothetical protein
MLRHLFEALGPVLDQVADDSLARKDPRRRDKEITREVKGIFVLACVLTDLEKSSPATLSNTLDQFVELFNSETDVKARAELLSALVLCIKALDCKTDDQLVEVIQKLARELPKLNETDRKSLSGKLRALAEPIRSLRLRSSASTAVDNALKSAASKTTSDGQKTKGGRHRMS